MAGSRTDRPTSAAPTICKIVVKVSIVIKTLTNVCLTGEIRRFSSFRLIAYFRAR
jgi:hypothetical protein